MATRASGMRTTGNGDAYETEGGPAERWVLGSERASKQTRGWWSVHCWGHGFVDEVTGVVDGRGVVRFDRGVVVGGGAGLGYGGVGSGETEAG